MGKNPLEIIFLKPAFVPKLWGSQQLATLFNFDLPKNEPIGEAWLISAHPNGMSYILNGLYKDMSLAALFKEQPQLFGTHDFKEYPLLTKILDANDNLSVQIHPDDEYAELKHQCLGKTECWYVLNCLPKTKNPQIILGHNAKDKNQFKEWLDKRQFKKLLKTVPIKKDDFIYVPSLKIHGLMANTIVFELQQSSDITYRLYDYDRVDNFGNPRKLHIDETLDIIIAPDKNSSEANSHDDYLVDNNFFKLIKINNIDVKGYHYHNVNWLQVTVLDGEGLIDNVEIKKGDSFILPNGYDKFVLTGKLMMMVSYC